MGKLGEPVHPVTYALPDPKRPWRGFQVHPKRRRLGWVRTPFQGEDKACVGEENIASGSARDEMDALWRLSLIDFKGEWKLAENRGVDQGRAVQMPIWRTLRSWPSTANSENRERSRDQHGNSEDGSNPESRAKLHELAGGGAEAGHA